MAMSEEWSTHRVDGMIHTTFWVAEWPRTEVHSDFLAPLLLSSVRATLSVVMEPLGSERAIRKVEASRTADLADSELRRRGGFVATARHARESEVLARREGELADGHASFRYAGFVTVSAEDEATLAVACDAIARRGGPVSLGAPTPLRRSGQRVHRNLAAGSRPGVSALPRCAAINLGAKGLEVGAPQRGQHRSSDRGPDPAGEPPREGQLFSPVEHRGRLRSIFEGELTGAADRPAVMDRHSSVVLPGGDRHAIGESDRSHLGVAFEFGAHPAALVADKADLGRVAHPIHVVSNLGQFGPHHLPWVRDWGCDDDRAV